MNHGDYNMECCDFGEWQAIMAGELSSATAFEIHRWSDEQEWIDIVLQFGDKKNTEWTGGVVIAGEINPRFADWLLALPKPCDVDIYDKMTPFFSVFLNNGFSSEHYGTELTKE